MAKKAAKTRAPKEAAAPVVPAAPAGLEIEHLDIEVLTQDPANARAHPERNLEALRGSLQRFGQQKPIVIDDRNVVRAGNATLQVARELGWKKIYAVRSELRGSDAVAFAIADNRVADLSVFDYEALAPQLKALQEDGFNLEELGWMPHEVEPLLAADFNPGEKGDLSEHTRCEPIAVTLEQRVTIEQAIEKVRAANGDPDLAEGRAIELICADFLGGA